MIFRGKIGEILIFGLMRVKVVFVRVRLMRNLRVKNGDFRAVLGIKRCMENGSRATKVLSSSSLKRSIAGDRTPLKMR